MVVYDIVAMLTMCSVINSSTRQKLYTYKQYEVNTNRLQILHPEHLKLLKLK